MAHGPGVQICGECGALAEEMITSQHEQAARDRHSGRRLIG